MSITKRWRWLAVLAVFLLVVTACGDGEDETTTTEAGATTTEATTTTAAPEEPTTTAAAPVGEYVRAETLYTSGTQWGPPSNWNPMVTWGYATGTLGLVYEPLFIYDPFTDEYIPWLAESGEWTSDNVYVVTLRQGVKWSDDEDFNAEDVVATFDLGEKYESVQYHPMFEWLESYEATGDYEVTFTFSDPLYQEWGNFLYSRPMLPEHIWSSLSEEEVTNGANENPIGTGPYVYETHDQDRMVWVKRSDAWWATAAYGYDPAPTRVIDIVNGSNNVALGLVLQGGLDLSNNFLPGVATLVAGGYGIQTYYPDAPYMLAANTAWIVTNNTKAPLSDPEFRKALANSIDVSKIVQNVYGNIVSASNPVGLLPIWEQYVDQDLVAEKGFSYDEAKAKQILADAGYADTNGDDFVEGLDGSEIALKIIVPFGWTDWMESIRVISEGAMAAGINLEVEFPDYSAYADAKNAGDYDTLIANDAQMSNTPWTYYDWMFQEPIMETMTNGNFGRYDNQVAFDLVTELDKVKLGDVEGLKAVIGDLQDIQLTDYPIIPLWYNGLWAQYSTAVWSNWPGSGDDQNHYLPASWRGYWNMTAILMLCDLQPTPTE